MSHLSAERLAELADAGEWPTAGESEHLAACRACTEERRAYEALVGGARAERAVIGTPLTEWNAIVDTLRAEGLTVPAAGPKPVPVGARTVEIAARRRLFDRGVRVAAGFALLVVGIGAGRITAVAGPLAADPGAAGTSMAAGAPDGRALLPPGVSGADFDPEALVPDYRSVAEAQAALARFEVAYQHAAAYVAGNDSVTHLDSPADYHKRLVALERAGRTMREAMQESPYDPVITGYYLTTLGQREATLRQLNVAMPATARLNSF